MRIGLYIPQRAIVERDFLAKVTTDGWLLLDYLRRWVNCKNVKKVQVRGREFFWMKYTQACRELPILFPRRPILRTQINKMVQLVASLKEHGLIDTVRLGSRCYIHLTDAAHRLYLRPAEPETRFVTDCVTSPRDGADMEKCDDRVMRGHDGESALYKQEQYNERHYTQNSYTNDQLESAKRKLQTIFPKRNWSDTEIALLRRQMPIPDLELTLILRFYQLPSPGGYFRPDKLPEPQFLLARRRKTLRKLLEYWGDEVSRAQWFFKSDDVAAQ